MGGGYNTCTKYFYDLITRYRRNKSDRDKAKLKQLVKRKKELVEKLKPILEQVKILEVGLTSIEDKEYKILNKYSYEVRVAELNPHYEKEYYVF